MSRFGWYELFTTDTEAAKDFYSKVVGWTTQSWEQAPDYTMWVSPTGPVGGLMVLGPKARKMGAPPHWMGYISVDNVGDTVTQVQSLGGRVYVPPSDLPDGGRFAIVGDPQGAGFGLHQARDAESQMPPPEGFKVGHFGWAELMTSDIEAGFEFYSKLFGWEKQDAMEMGEGMGVYQLFGLGKDTMLGGMMKRPPDMPMSAWTFYANVADADRAAELIKANGGNIIHGPAEVPGGGRIVMYTDPQGAMAAVFAEK